jgi:hypothetical protein
VAALARQLTDPPGQADERRVAGRHVTDAHLRLGHLAQRVGRGVEHGHEGDGERHGDHDEEPEQEEDRGAPAALTRHPPHSPPVERPPSI